MVVPAGTLSVDMAVPHALMGDAVLWVYVLAAPVVLVVLVVAVLVPGVMVSDQLSSVPLRPPESLIINRQVPPAFRPLKLLNAVSGRKVPENGALPELIGVLAWSEKTVFVKLAPVPPRSLTSASVRPLGATR